MNNIEAFYSKLNLFIDYFKSFIEISLAQPYTKHFLIGLVSLILLLIIWRKITKHFRPIKLFNNSLGVVEVSRKALDELVQNVCYKLGALSKPKVKIFVKRGRLSVKVSLKIEGNQMLAEVSSQIQEDLVRKFRDHLGVEKLGSIDVSITGFRGLRERPLPKFEPMLTIHEEDKKVF